MKHPYLILAIILMVTLLLIFDRLELKDRRMRDGSAIKDPADGLLPADKVANDKLIIVEAISEQDIKGIVRDFCGWYNREMLQVIPVVTRTMGQEFAITFPYDVQFEIFCFLINYLTGPKGYNRGFCATGWATTRSADMWITEENANKQVVLFVPDFVPEYDNVFMTTIDEVGYKLDFGRSKARLLDHPGKPFRASPLAIEDLSDGEMIMVHGA